MRVYWRLAPLLIVFVSAAGTVAAAEPTYWQDARPVLRRYCTTCHSVKNLKELDISGGLALDSYAAVRQGAKQPVIVPGKSADSLLIQLATTTDTEKRMPLGALPMPPESVAILRRWIDSGAREGEPPSVAEDTEITPTKPARTRKLDVLLTTTAVPPAGLLGAASPNKLELALKVGPLAPVAAVVFSPDGKLLATGSYSRVTIWDMTTVRPLKVLTSVLGAVNDLRFSPDGSLLAVAGGQPSAKGDLRLFQVSDWKLLASLGGHDNVVFSVAFSPDGKHLASASFDKTVRVWDVAAHKVERVLTGHADFVYSVAFSPDGKWIASASKDRTVKLEEAATGKSLFTFSGMDQDVLAVAISPDGKSVVSSGFEAGLYWWNPQTGERVRVQGGHSVAVHEIGFSKDGSLVVSAGADKTIRLWSGSTGAAGKVLPVGSIAYAVALSPDGKRVAAGSFDGLVRLWDVESGRQLLTLLTLPPQGEAFDWLAVTPEGYTASSVGLGALGQWRMSNQAVNGELVWKALAKPEVVARAARGETVTPPVFEK